MSNFIKIHIVGAVLFHVDGRIDRQTDMMKLIVAFHNFLNVPRNVLSSLQLTHKLQKLCSSHVQLLSEMGGDVSTSD